MSAAALHGLPIRNEQLDRVHLTRDRQGQGQDRPAFRPPALHADRRTAMWSSRQLPGHQPGTHGRRSRAALWMRCMPYPSVMRRYARGSSPSSPLVEGGGLGWSPQHCPRPAVASVTRRAQGKPWGVDEAGACFTNTDAAARATNGGLRPFWKVRWPVRLWLAGERTLGEFEGRGNYGRLLLRPGQRPEQALFEEKRREDALGDLG